MLNAEEQSRVAAQRHQKVSKWQWRQQRRSAGKRVMKSRTWMGLEGPSFLPALPLLRHANVVLGTRLANHRWLRRRHRLMQGAQAALLQKQMSEFSYLFPVQIVTLL